MGLFDSGVGGNTPKQAKRVGNPKKQGAPGGKKKRQAGDNALSKVLANFGIDYPDAPAPSPALLAFARGLGMNLSASEDTRNRGIEQVQGRSADALDDLGRTSERGKKAVTSDLVRRGVLSSGESNTRYARQAEDVADRRADIARTKVEGVSAVDSAFEQAKGSYRTQLLERVLGHETETSAREASAAAQKAAIERQDAAAEAAHRQQKQAQEEYLKTMEELYKKYGAQ